jgi:FkbM family methyltransferase
VTWDHLQWVDRGPHTDDTLGPDNHEPGLAELLWDLLPDGGVFCDVGAHVGRYAVRLAAKAARVYAVEAMPGTARVLAENVVLNGLANVDVIQAALWSEPVRLAFADPMGQTDGGSNRGVPAEHGIQARTLDSLNLGRVDLIKIDVEGAEGHVLRGGRDLLVAWHPTLLVEMHDRLYGREIREMVFTEIGRCHYDWDVGYCYEGSWYLLAR